MKIRPLSRLAAYLRESAIGSTIARSITTAKNALNLGERRPGSTLTLPEGGRDSEGGETPQPEVDLRIVTEVMTAPPRSILCTVSLREAARLMKDESLGDVMVINDSGDLLGMLTDPDLTMHSAVEHVDPATFTLEEIVSPIAASIPPTATMSEAADVMRQHDVSRLPVIANGKVVGIVTLSDTTRSSDTEIVIPADIPATPLDI